MNHEMDTRTRSKILFGNSYMLEVCVGVAEVDDRVCLSSLLADSDLSPSVYAGPLKKLVQLGLLLDAPRPDDDHRDRWYAAADSQLWTAAVQLAERPKGDVP